MDKKLKDKVTNIVGVLMLVVGAVDTYLKTTNAQDISLTTLGLAILGAIVAYYTGK